MSELSKIDPSIFNILPIKWEEEPSDSLSSININFLSLDAGVCNLELSGNNFWNPLYNDFNSGSAEWESLFSTVRDNSACWSSTYNTVRTLSSRWSSPVSIIYPFPINSVNPTTFSAWVIRNFPVRTGTCINYTEGQEFFLFIKEWDERIQRIEGDCEKKLKNQGPDLKCISAVMTYNPIPPNWGGYKKHCDKLYKCKNRGALKFKDRYTSRVRGLRFVVENGQWVYKNLMY